MARIDAASLLAINTSWWRPWVSRQIACREPMNPYSSQRTSGSFCCATILQHSHRPRCAAVDLQPEALPASYVARHEPPVQDIAAGQHIHLHWNSLSTCMSLSARLDNDAAKLRYGNCPISGLAAPSSADGQATRCGLKAHTWPSYPPRHYFAHQIAKPLAVTGRTATAGLTCQV